MKNHFYLILVTIFLINIVSCQPNKDESACNVEDPLQLCWIKELIQDLRNDSSVIEAEILLYRFESNDYFLVKQKKDSIYDIPTGHIYDCKGTIKYACGGNQQNDSCSIFLSKSLKITSLWIK